MMKLLMYLIMLMLMPPFILNNYLNMFMYIMVIMMILITLINVNFNSYFMNIYYCLGVETISLSLIILSFLIISLMFLVSMKIKYKMFNQLLLILLISLIFSFSWMNYFLFYLFFEISLLPTFILIMMFGYQPERINASMYMMFYTLFASLPLMMIIFYIFYSNNSLMYFFIYKDNLINSLNYKICYFFMNFAFLVKLPMFMFHMWLPKAHVEAPISGSMILAGVMLKLGGYGLFRSLNMSMKLSKNFNISIMILNILGIVYLSMMCLRQNDFKVLIAYSSVVHMSMMLSSLMTMMILGKFSLIIMMFGHGLCSPGMFMMMNFIYERTKSRNIYINKGMMSIFPSMMLMWFLLCIGNMGAPISLNLISEIFIMMSLLIWSNYLLLILIISMFISASYSLFLFCSISHGQMFSQMKNLYNNKIIEFKSLLLLLLPLNIFFIKMDLFM